MNLGGPRQNPLTLRLMRLWQRLRLWLWGPERPERPPTLINCGTPYLQQRERDEKPVELSSTPGGVVDKNDLHEQTARDAIRPNQIN
jgi:hypothetical protein